MTDKYFTMLSEGTMKYEAHLAQHYILFVLWKKIACSGNILRSDKYFGK